VTQKWAEIEGVEKMDEKKVIGFLSDWIGFSRLPTGQARALLQCRKPRQ